MGNLDQVMEACPNANLVCSWAITERYTNAFDFPLGRCQLDGRRAELRRG